MKVIKITATETSVKGLGEKIRCARKLSKKSLKQLCIESKLSYTYWYKVEKEEIDSLSLATLEKMQNSLGVDFGVKFSSR